ncbi:hypothetical protein QOT17_017891 [Balamuthia mandrillaris]
MLEEVVERDEKRRRSPSSRVDDAFVLLLARTKVEDVHTAKSKLLTATKNEPLPSAFKKMVENNIWSLPVMNQGGRYFGFVDMVDVVTHLLDKVDQKHLTEGEQVGIDDIEQVKSATVRQIMTYPLSKKNPFHPIMKGSSLLTAVEALSRGAHRVPIVDENDQLINLITQSGMIGWIHSHMEALGERRNLKVEDMGDCVQYVLSVLSTDPAIEGFRQLKAGEVSAVAIIDQNTGALIGNLSAKDIKRVWSDVRFLPRLFDPVTSFIDQRRHRVISVRMSDTLETVVNKLHQHRVHRVYIVAEDEDEQNVTKAIGVISLSDVLRMLLP